MTRARTLIAVASILLAVACAASVAAGQTPSGALRLTWWTDVGFPTPFAASTLGPGGLVRLSLIYDTLVWKDRGGAIPWLADSWQVSPDGRRYTFVLRSGIRWHDGRPFTARDVQFSFEYYREHPFVWTDTGMVQSVRAEGARTVTFVLSDPFAPFIEDVAGVVPIVPEHLWKEVREPRKAQSIEMAAGTGPYVLAEYRPGSGEYRLRANPGYFRGRPLFSEIQYTMIPTERQVLAAQNGQVDAAMADTYDVVPAFSSHPFLKVWQSEPLSIARLLFNLSRPPFDRREARRAVAHAINRTQLATLMTRGPGIPGNPGVVSPFDRWYAPRVRGYPNDPAQARSLMMAAGHSAPQVELLSSPSPVVVPIQEMLRRAGTEVTVRTVDARTRAALVSEGKFQMALTFHIGAGGDPDYLRRWFAGGEANLFGQSPGFDHAEFLRLASEQARSVDAGTRRALISRMQEILADELPTLALYYRRFYWVHDSRRLRPVDVPGGIMNGIPLVENKLALIGSR